MDLPPPRRFASTPVQEARAYDDQAQAALYSDFVDRLTNLRDAAVSRGMDPEDVAEALIGTGNNTRDYATEIVQRVR